MGLARFQTPKNGITGMLQQLSNLDLVLRSKKASVPREQYEKFCYEFIFNALKGEEFGPAFCKEFKIVDYILLMTKNNDEAKRYIEIAKYIDDKGTA